MAVDDRNTSVTTKRRRPEPMTSIMIVCLVVGILTIGIALVSERFLIDGDGPGASSIAAGPQLPVSESGNPSAISSEPKQSDDSDDASTPAQYPIMPSRLQIPRLDIDANIQHVGYTDDGRMDEPDNWDDVAWFQYGFFPGASGNSVIAGHLDSDTGPAVFAGLYLMEPGDEISVTGENGEVLTFVVTEVERVLAEEAPLERIFGDSETPRLNLITCEGHFDPEEEDYDHRLVVYTELVGS